MSLVWVQERLERSSGAGMASGKMRMVLDTIEMMDEPPLAEYIPHLGPVLKSRRMWEEVVHCNMMTLTNAIKKGCRREGWYTEDKLWIDPKLRLARMEMSEMRSLRVDYTPGDGSPELGATFLARWYYVFYLGRFYWGRYESPRPEFKVTKTVVIS